MQAADASRDVPARPGTACTAPAARSCRDCGLAQRLPALAPGLAARCARCGATLRRTWADPLPLCLALGVASLVLFAAAALNDLAVVRSMGQVRTADLLASPDAMVRQGLWELGALVFLTSVAAPFLVPLLTVYALGGARLRRPPPGLALAFRLRTRLRPWSMVEVFLVGYFVAYTKLGALAEIRPGLGFYALFGLMVATIATDAVMDEQAVWEAVQEAGARRAPPRAGALARPAPAPSADVGKVVGWDFAGMADSVTLHVFVAAPYAGWVHRDSRFWNSSGIQLRVGAEGVRLQVDSLKAAVLGGITFETPAHAGGDAGAANEVAKGAAPIEDGASFPLYATEEAAETATAPRRAVLASYFTGSVGGLAVGARVTLQGLPIGDVTSVDLQYSTDTDQTRVRVGFAVQLDRVAPVGSKPVQPFRGYVRTLVREGLRTRLKGGNLITGQKEVAMEFVPGAAPAELTEEGEAQVIPADGAGGGGLDDLTATAGALMAKLAAMPFAEIGQNLNGALRGASEVSNSPQLRQALARLNGTLSAVQDTVRHVDAGAAPALKRLPAIAADLQETLAQVRTLAASVSAGSTGDSKFGRDLDRMLTQVTDAAGSLRMVADLLARHPEALVRGRAGRALE